MLNRLFGKSSGGPGVIRPAEAQARLSGPEAAFWLDVRQPEEFRAGHVPGATLIPLNELAQRLGELPRDREIIVVCRSGSRSGAATRHLSSAGYRALNLAGGMIAWQMARLPVRTGGTRHPGQA
jgi:rhodanese-related sulfurtransferase